MRYALPLLILFASGSSFAAEKKSEPVLNFRLPQGVTLNEKLSKNDQFRFEWKSGSVLVLFPSLDLLQNENTEQLIDRQLKSFSSMKRLHNGDPDYWKVGEVSKMPVDLGPWKGWLLSRRNEGQKAEIEIETIWVIRDQSKTWTATFGGSPNEYKEACATLTSATKQKANKP
jgi:hypothetical protein